MRDVPVVGAVPYLALFQGVGDRVKILFLFAGLIGFYRPFVLLR
jgi:hypothetical protein